ESAAGGGQRLRRNGSAPLAPPGSGASANGVATPAAAVARQAAGAATPAPATQADADATQRPAERRADLRIAPPVLMLWQRLRHWYAELSDRGAAAPQ
ncbi:MAG TPA: hypothetical protein PLF73_02815, partial [Luteimonas sp.]|nr:hypothetical protein [Luteimonas sp.]